MVSWAEEKVYDKIREYTRLWEWRENLDIKFLDYLNSVSNPQKNKNNKIVQKARQIILECKKRTGMVWFIQCISVNDVVVDLVWVKKNLFSNTELIKTTDYIEDLHATIFAGPTGCGKSHFLLDLIGKKCNKHLNYIFIIWPMLRWNKT